MTHFRLKLIDFGEIMTIKIIQVEASWVAASQTWLPLAAGSFDAFHNILHIAKTNKDKGQTVNFDLLKLQVEI